MLQQLIVFLFQFLLFTVPLFFTTNTDELFEFNKMVLTYALTVIILCSWCLRMVLEKKVIFQRTRFDIPILFFLVSQIVSTVLSMHPQTSMMGYYSRFHGGLLSTLTYLSLYYAFVSNIRKTDLQKIFVSLFSSSLVVSIYAIFEHFGHSTSCLLITGSFDVSCWIQDVKTRVFATFGQPNWLAAYLVMIVPLSTILAAITKHKYLSLFYAATSIFGFAALLFTQSRSGFLGIVGAVTVLCLGYLTLSKLRSSITSSSTNKRVLAAMGVFCVLSAVIFGTPYTPSLQTLTAQKETSETIQNNENSSVNRLEIGGTDSGEIRKIVWTGAIDIWKRYPFFGSGVETFAYSYYKDRPLSHNNVSEWDFLYNKAHNEYLNFLATTGLFGLSTYLLLQIWFSLSLVKVGLTPKLDKNTRLILLALLAGYTAVSISNFFGFSTVMIGILFFLFPAFMVVYLEENSITTLIEKSTKKTPTDESIIPYIGVTLIGFTTVIVLGSIFRYWHADTLFSQGKSYLGIGEYAQGFNLLDKAIQENPEEAAYYDALADSYSQVVSQLHSQGEATMAGQLTQGALSLSAKALELNPAHLNYYKTQIRVYVNLANNDPSYLEKAVQTTRIAIDKAPTDPKLEFTLAQILKAQGKDQDALLSLERTVALKPNYESAWQLLAEIYLEQGNTAKAVETANHILENLNTTNARAQEIATYSASLD